MNASEALKLLSVLAEIDRREFNATTGQAWAWALEDVEYARGLEAAKRAMKAGEKYIDLQTIQHQLRAMQPRLEADVRSAKLRGVIPDDWPKHKPLTLALEAELRHLQKIDYSIHNDAALDTMNAPKELDA